MRRFYSLLCLVLMFSAVQIVAARTLRIDRKAMGEATFGPTALAAPTSRGSIMPQTTKPLPSITSSTAELTPTTTLSSTATLSATMPLTATNGVTNTMVFTATVIGYVREVGSETPIPGADVIIGGVAIVSREDGTFGPVDVPIAAASEDVDGTASAVGHERWTFKGIPLQDAKKLDIHIQLRKKGTAVPAPSRTYVQPSHVGAPPEKIRLGITGSSNCVVPAPGEVRVVEMPFADYLRNVLPNEWFATWPDASLDAGAVAVKQFAWYTAFIERKWSNQGYNFDLLDSTCDQHYVRNSYTAATDAALKRTWALTLTRDGKLFPTFYRSLDTQCVRSRSDDCMGQSGNRGR